MKMPNLKTAKNAAGLPADLPFFERFLPDGQQWFSPKEVAAILGRSDQWVRKAFEAGTIFGCSANGTRPAARQKKQYISIPRDCLLLFLATSANFSGADYTYALVDLAKRLNERDIKLFYNALASARNKI